MVKPRSFSFEFKVERPGQAQIEGQARRPIFRIKMQILAKAWNLVLVQAVFKWLWLKCLPIFCRPNVCGSGFRRSCCPGWLTDRNGLCTRGQSCFVLLGPVKREMVNVGWVNIHDHHHTLCVTKHFIVWPPSLMMYAGVFWCSIEFETGLTFSSCSHLWCAMFDRLAGSSTNFWRMDDHYGFISRPQIPEKSVKMVKMFDGFRYRFATPFPLILYKNVGWHNYWWSCTFIQHFSLALPADRTCPSV